jgi:hypothetical protein
VRYLGRRGIWANDCSSASHDYSSNFAGTYDGRRFTAPWCVYTKVRSEDCRSFLAAPSQIIAYHFIIEGSLFVSVEGAPALQAHEGKIVLLPRNDAHTLASGPGLEPKNARDLIQPAADGGLARVPYGGGGAPVHLACGFLASDQLYNPLIDALPKILKIDVCLGTLRNWVEASVRLAANELIERSPPQAWCRDFANCSLSRRCVTIRPRSKIRNVDG